MKKSSTLAAAVDILDYRPEYQPWFESLNREWIEKHFWMEPIDTAVLQHPEEHILKHGGVILMIQYNREIAGTAALKFVEPGVYEFTKMAVDKKFRGNGLGRALAEASIQKAKGLGAHSIILYSNRILENAIALYRKLGFVELPVDPVYKRSDIKMKLDLK
jgi:GNAT superfamily N-acetyltransferase